MELDDHRSVPSRRQKGGRACINCARIKCKCISRAEGPNCERCHRLNKICEPSPLEKRRGPKRQAASRSARLEEKLDDLVSMLRSKNIPLEFDREDTGGDGSDNDGTELEEDTSPHSTENSLTTIDATFDEIYADEPSPLEAENSLNEFREDMMSLVPYIYIPPHETAVQLRRAYPFLWLTIMTVTAKKVSTRYSLGEQARIIIVQRVVGGGGERTLDMLLGILTFVTWYPLFPITKHFASLASHIAINVLWDLGLHSPRPKKPNMCYPTALAPTMPQPARTLEEKRAVLGTFIISSMAAQSMKAPDGLRWSPHLDEYLSNIANQSTVPQDAILVAQVKMQLIFNQIRHASYENDNAEIPFSYVDLLQPQLDNIAAAIKDSSSALYNNSNVLRLYHYVSLYIYGSAICRPNAAKNEPMIRRHAVYQFCLDAIKSWLGIFFSLPLDAYTKSSFITYSQLFFVMISLHRVTTVKDTAWNSIAARETVDPLATLDRIIHLFEQLRNSPAYHRNERDDGLAMGFNKFQALKMAWKDDFALKGPEDWEVQDDHMVDGSQINFPTPPMDYSDIFVFPGLFEDVSWQ